MRALVDVVSVAPGLKLASSVASYISIPTSFSQEILFHTGLKLASSVASRADNLSFLVNIIHSRKTFPYSYWSARILPGLSGCTVHSAQCTVHMYRAFERMTILRS